MTKFKVGDRVKTRNGMGTVRNVQRGYPEYLVEHDNKRPHLHDGNGIGDIAVPNNTGWWYGARSLELKEKTMDNLEVGDKLVSSDSWLTYTRKVVSIFEYAGEKQIVTADSDDGELVISTVEQLRDDNWDIEKEEELKEVTLEEIAKAMNVDVSKLRIKE